MGRIKTAVIRMSLMKKVIAGTSVLSLLFLIAVLIFGAFSVKAVISVFIGGLYAVGNFRVISDTIENAMTKSPKAARGYTFGMVMLRYFAAGVLMYIALTYDFLEPYAVIPPLFFPKISLIVYGFVLRKDDAKTAV